MNLLLKLTTSYVQQCTILAAEVIAVPNMAASLQPLSSAARRPSGETAQSQAAPTYFLPRRSLATPPWPKAQMSIPAKHTDPRGKTIFVWSELGPDTREDFIRKDLTRRLQGMCENLSKTEFAALVMKMTREQLRGERLPELRIPPSCSPRGNARDSRCG
jgi:hypothetical protein